MFLSTDQPQQLSHWLWVWVMCARISNQRQFLFTGPQTERLKTPRVTRTEANIFTFVCQVTVWPPRRLFMVQKVQSSTIVRRLSDTNRAFSNHLRRCRALVPFRGWLSVISTRPRISSSFNPNRFGDIGCRLPKEAGNPQSGEAKFRKSKDHYKPWYCTYFLDGKSSVLTAPQVR